MTRSDNSRSSFQARVQRLGRADYASTLAAMSGFTDKRGPDTPDEIWLLEHPPVYTLGLNANRSHLIAPGNVDVVQVDRGGQVTYHGPGQLVAYALLDLKRAGLGVRDLVGALEKAMIAVAALHGVSATRRRDAPGIYAGEAKLGSVGLRIRRGCSYHGIALNVDMDLEPFSRIDPCGFAGLPVTQLKDLADPVEIETVMDELGPIMIREIRSAAGQLTL